MLKEVIEKALESDIKNQIVVEIVEECEVSIAAGACKPMEIQHVCYYYLEKLMIRMLKK